MLENLVRMAIAFCDRYKTYTFSDINNPIDKKIRHFQTIYNDILDNLISDNVIVLLGLSDYLNISPLMKLICFKLSHLIRDISY